MPTAIAKSEQQVQRQRVRLVLKFGVFGLLSGCGVWGLLHLEDSWNFDEHRSRLSLLGLDLEFAPTSLIPGLVFGVVIGLALLRRGAASAIQLMIYILAATASNFAATNLAKNMVEAVDSLLMTGMIAGLFGAACLTAASIAIFPFSRQWQPCLSMLVAGCLLGGLLVIVKVHVGSIGFEWLILYALWQGGYAAALGTGVPRIASATIPER